MSYLSIIKDQTYRSIRSLYNVVQGIPDEYWGITYSEIPIWRHIYHTVHSLDKWYINPARYEEPEFHIKKLDDLNVVDINTQISREQIEKYMINVFRKTLSYIDSLDESMLRDFPEGCNYSRFHLILAQHRHLDMHIGMLMGFVINYIGEWPQVLGIDTDLNSKLSLYC